MGRVYITDTDCRFTYDDQYLETGLPGLGVVYAPEHFGKTTITMARNERFDLLPPLQALIPPRHAENFQRNLALKYLASRGIKGLTGFDADWEILKVSGHGGIGHLDLFEDDDKARAWYNNVPPQDLYSISDELGFSLKEFITWFEDDIDVLIQTIGPTPSVGGAIPKLLLAIPASGWDGRIGLPTRQKSPGVTDVVPGVVGSASADSVAAGTSDIAGSSSSVALVPGTAVRSCCCSTAGSAVLGPYCSTQV